MADKLKMNLSFPQYEKHIYDFVKSQPNPSAFIRKLIENYMNGNMIGGYTTPMQQQVVGYFNQLPAQFPTQPSLNEEKEDEIPDEAIVACMSINRLTGSWKVKCVMSNTCIVDDNDYFDPYDYIDINGFRDHKFYECHEYGYEALKYLNEHAKLIVNLVLTDLDNGLWSVDLRTKTVQSLLNYISIIVGLDVSKRVLEKRKEIKESSKLASAIDISYIETEE